MPGFWRTHNSFQKRPVERLSSIASSAPFPVLEYEAAISKALILNLDPLCDVVAPLYSNTGRPSLNRPEIFRPLVLMNDLGHSLDEWVHSKLPKNPVLQAACGFFDGGLPAIASYYDFIDRIIELDEKPRHKRKKRKPTKKHGKKKLPPKHPNIVARLVDKILAGRRLGRRPERILQQIFADVCVSRSIAMGLVPQSVSVSGDGTCLLTGASHRGVKTCRCSEGGDYKCLCPRRFSDPNATWGWDSHNERYFYGYTGYFISTYNKAERLDLPLYLRLVGASRHDGVSAVVALAEFRDLYPGIQVDSFISDSASDNHATYGLLKAWGVNAVIALAERGNFKYPSHLKLDENGAPICIGGHTMAYWGKCPDRDRMKWRCPFKLGKVRECGCTAACSPSDYGRTIYTYPKWDLRLFTGIPRGTDEWKPKFRYNISAYKPPNTNL